MTLESTAGRLLTSRYIRPLTPSISVAPVVLFALALLVRGYRLTDNPLWFDELIVNNLGQQGVDMILRRFLVDVHPPIYYLIQWFAAGAGHFQTEWGWRWPAVLTGSLTVPLVYKLAKDLTSNTSALLSSLLLLVAPVHIFFSQEARPYAFLLLLITLSILILRRLEREPDRRRAVLMLGAVSIFGIYCHYSYAMIAGVQLLYLWLGPRTRRISLGLGAGIFLAVLPLLALALSPLLRFASQVKSDSLPQLTFTDLLQAFLLIDPERYGLLPAHAWITFPFGLLLAAALRRGLREGPSRLNVYLWLQLLAPVAAYFLLNDLLDINLPSYESRQFVLLLPAFFILVSLGIECVREIRPRVVGVVALVVIVVSVCLAYSVALERVWTKTKSPEGSLIWAIREQLGEDDALVVLHYSVASAATFYLPHAPRYKVAVDSEGTRGALLPAAPGTKAEDELESLAAVAGRHKHLWLVFFGTSDRGLRAPLANLCREDDHLEFAPFQAVRFDCAIKGQATR